MLARGHRLRRAPQALQPLHAQVATKRESPAHREDLIFDVLRGVRVADIMVKDRPYENFEETTPSRDIVHKVAGSAWQDVFPVLVGEGKLVGVVMSRRAAHDGREPGHRRAHRSRTT